MSCSCRIFSRLTCCPCAVEVDSSDVFCASIALSCHEPSFVIWSRSAVFFFGCLENIWEWCGSTETNGGFAVRHQCVGF